MIRAEGARISHIANGQIKTDAGEPMPARLAALQAGLAEAGMGCWQTLTLPQVPDLFAPMLYAIPAQLLAYHTAIAKGTDVDQPRNLAKSVTVE